MAVCLTNQARAYWNFGFMFGGNPPPVYYSSHYCSNVVPDDHGGRKQWFEQFLKSAHDCQLVFFDPDNGIEVPSKCKGSRDSSKYLYWDELVQTYRCGHSLLVYQHFPRRQRSQFIAEMESAIAVRTDAPAVYSLRTPHIVFFLVPRPEHLNQIVKLKAVVATAWQGK